LNFNLRRYTKQAAAADALKLQVQAEKQFVAANVLQRATEKRMQVQAERDAEDERKRAVGHTRDTYPEDL
jgi:hypothetical protein